MGVPAVFQSEPPPIMARRLVSALEVWERTPRRGLQRQTVIGLDEGLLKEWNVSQIFDPNSGWVDARSPAGVHRIRALLAFEVRHMRRWIDQYLGLRSTQQSPEKLALHEPVVVQERVRAHLATVSVDFQPRTEIKSVQPQVHPWRSGARKQGKPNWWYGVVGVQEQYRTSDLLAIAWLELFRLITAGAAIGRCVDCQSWVYFAERPQRYRGRPASVRCQRCREKQMGDLPPSHRPEYYRLLMASRANDPKRRQEAREKLERYRREQHVRIRRQSW